MAACSSPSSRPRVTGRQNLLDADSIDACKGYLQRAEETGVEIVLPTDIVCGKEFSSDTETTVVGGRHPGGHDGPGHRPERAAAYAAKLADARTVFWNGPMGAFEMAPFAAGTKAVAQASSTPRAPAR